RCGRDTGRDRRAGLRLLPDRRGARGHRAGHRLQGQEPGRDSGHRRAPARRRRLERADGARSRRVAHRGVPGQRTGRRRARRDGGRRMVHGAGRTPARACRTLGGRRQDLRRSRRRRRRRSVRLCRRRAADRRRRDRELVAARRGRDRARDSASGRRRPTRRAAGRGHGRRRAAARHAAARDQRRYGGARVDRSERRASPHDSGAVAVTGGRSIFRAPITALAAAALLAGCVTRAPLTDDYDGPEALPEPLAERYELELEPAEAVTDAVRERRDFVVREVVLPGRESIDGMPPIEELRFEYYDVGEAVTPAIVVLPIANGNMLVSRYFARYFASRGWAALVIDHHRDPMDDLLDDPESIIRQNIIDYRRVLDWVERQPEIDAVGIFGVSFGGMAAVMLAALDERVDAVVAAMAGGDLPYLMVNTSYRAVAR